MLSGSSLTSLPLIETNKFAASWSFPINASFHQIPYVVCRLLGFTSSAFFRSLDDYRQGEQLRQSQQHLTFYHTPSDKPSMSRFNSPQPIASEVHLFMTWLSRRQKPSGIDCDDPHSIYISITIPSCTHPDTHLQVARYEQDQEGELGHADDTQVEGALKWRFSSLILTCLDFPLPWTCGFRGFLHAMLDVEGPILRFQAMSASEREKSKKMHTARKILCS